MRKPVLKGSFGQLRVAPHKLEYLAAELGPVMLLGWGLLAWCTRERLEREWWWGGGGGGICEGGESQGEKGGKRGGDWCWILGGLDDEGGE